MSCNETDFVFPMLADVYYGIATQDAYGGLNYAWTFDRTVVGNFVYAGAKAKEEMGISVEIMQESLILGRVKEDLRKATDATTYPFTNILITNIRDCNGSEFYTEVSGSRDGESTLFEIATQQPFVNPFAKAEHYRLILRRSENQGEL